MALIRPRFDSWWHHSKKEIHSGLFFVPAGIQTGVLRHFVLSIIAKAIFLAARARLLLCNARFLVAPQ